MLYPYNYFHFYTTNNGNNSNYKWNNTDIDNMFDELIPTTTSIHNLTDHIPVEMITTELEDQQEHTQSTNNTFIDSETLDGATSSSTPTQSPMAVEPIIEYNGQYYNYMPQCAIKFTELDYAIAFIKELRDHSSALRKNLHLIIEYYLVHNITLLFTDHDDSVNDTLYDYIRDDGYLSVEYINNTSSLKIVDWNQTFEDEIPSLSMNKSEYPYSIELNSISYYLGNISLPIPITESPTMSPTPPSNCYDKSHQIDHGTIWEKSECYSVYCNDGNKFIDDRYCGDQCYSNGNYSSINIDVMDSEKTIISNSTCCKDCPSANDHCTKQTSCGSCIGSDKTCTWLGDHCSAVCDGEYCWNNGDCPAILKMYIHVTGLTMAQVNDNQVLLNHAIAESLYITENLIEDSLATKAPNGDKIELKKSISVTQNDEQRIPDILVNQNNEYLVTLNEQVKIAFEKVTSRIEILDVQYGGIEGEHHGSSWSSSISDDIWLANDSLMILSVCGALIFLTILALCYRYPIFSYCCCCVPIPLRRQMRNFTRNHCCSCCQRFSFGVLYDDDISDLIKRRREERMTNLQLRNGIEEQHHLNIDQDEQDNDNDIINIDNNDTKEEEYLEFKENRPHRKKRKKKKKKRKKKKKKKRDNNTNIIEENETINGDIMEQNNEIQMGDLRNNVMLYDNHDHDLIEEDETNTNFVMQ